MIGASIRTILTSDVTLGALVSTRIYSDLAPQNTRTLPYVVYRVSYRSKQHTQDLAAVDVYRIEFDLYADTYAGLQTLEGAVDDAIDRYPIGTVVGDYIMDGIAQEDSDDDPYDVDEDGAYKKTAYYNVRVKNA